MCSSTSAVLTSILFNAKPNAKPGSALFGGIALGAGVSAIVEADGVVSNGLKRVRNSAPEVASQLAQLFRGRFDGTDVDAAVSCVRAMKERVNEDQGDKAEKIKNEEGHAAAWMIALHMFGKATTPEVKDKIVREWDTSLSENKSHIVSQVMGLFYEWHKEMLTENFWALVSKDSDVVTIRAVKLAFLANATESEAKGLGDRLKGITNAELQDEIRETRWELEFKYDKNPKKFDPRAECVPVELPYAANRGERDVKKSDPDMKRDLKMPAGPAMGHPKIDLFGDPAAPTPGAR